MSSLKVLYVDDEADIREIASLSLELDPEITVQCESSGAGAVVRAADWLPDHVTFGTPVYVLGG